MRVPPNRIKPIIQVLLLFTSCYFGILLFLAPNRTVGNYSLTVSSKGNGQYHPLHEELVHSSHVTIQDMDPPSSPTYRLVVKVTDEEDGTTRVLTSGTVIKGSRAVSITAYVDDNQAPLSAVEAYLGDTQLFSSVGGWELFFRFDSRDFPDGAHEFRVTAIVNETLQVTFTCQVIVQNHDPLALGLAVACFALVLLVLALQVHGSQKRTVVALLSAGKRASTVVAGSPRANAKKPPTSAPPAPEHGVATPGLAPKTKLHPLPKGWKTFVPLPVLVVLLALLLTWLSMTPEPSFQVAFGPWLAYPLPHYTLLISAGLAVVATWKWRSAASTAIGTILYVFIVLGSVFAMVHATMEAGIETLLGDGMELTGASFLIVVGTTMLSWLAAPPPAVVLATRFSRWQVLPPRHPRQPAPISTPTPPLVNKHPKVRPP